MNPTPITEALARAFGFTRLAPVAPQWVIWVAGQPGNVPWSFLEQRVLGKRQLKKGRQ